MRLKHSILALVFLGALGWAAKSLLAQDPVEVAPNIYKVLFENEKVRVCDIDFKPGDKMGEHSHPDHLVYVLTPGQIKLSYADGTSKVMEAKAGEVLWSGAETHSSENIGTTEFHGIIVEFKGGPAKEHAGKEHAGKQ